jgi:acyl-CoA synthetase (AMP-forming)/AMP-acid ligase II
MAAISKDYPICIWAVHRLCAIISFVKAESRSRSTLTVLISPCNPMSTVAELSRQLVQTKASLLIAHERLLGVALASAREIGIPPDRVVVIGGTGKAPHMTIANLTNHGLHQAPYSGRQIGPGEGATKIALLCPSSGTTGLPKVEGSFKKIF